MAWIRIQRTTQGARRLTAALLLAACATSVDYQPKDADDLLIVDCLLPPRIKALGRSATYLEARKAIRTSAVDCRIRGGEYVAHDRASFATALEIWLPLARSGDAQAQNYVGEIYERGLGRGPDYEAAAHWFRLAAEQGDAAAQINLGQLYELGRSVPQSASIAHEWYRRASGLASSGAAFVAAAPPPSELELLRARLVDRRRDAEALAQERRRLGDAPREDERATLDARSAALAAAISRLESQLADAERRHGGAAAEPAPVDVAGPSIQILDPPIPLQRGIATVALPPAAKRSIVGRVDAAGGLHRLTVNGRETQTQEDGIFRAELEIPKSSLEVRVVAIDEQGKSAELRFELAPLEDRSRAPSAPAAEASYVGFGDYFALVIGNDDYATLPDLRTAWRDAQAVSQVLRERYGFKVTSLQNASRYQILSALEQLRGELDRDDNLLIYYAGHGELDEVNMRGHWLPVDAERESSANWISNVSITDILNAMQARHVMVVADACYSGTLTPSSLARLDTGTSDEERAAWIAAMVKQRSRTALTSGGLEPVLDGGGGEHSVFARVFLDVLERNRDVMEGRELFQEISARVTWEALKLRFEQVPEYAPIQYAGHESGDFFLVPVAR